MFCNHLYVKDPDSNATFLVEQFYERGDGLLDVRVIPSVRDCMIEYLSREYKIGEQDVDLGVTVEYLHSLWPDQFGNITITGLKAQQSDHRFDGNGWRCRPIFFWFYTPIYEEQKDQGYIVGANASFYLTLEEAFDLLTGLVCGDVCNRCGQTLMGREWVEVYGPPEEEEDNQRFCLTCWPQKFSETEQTAIWPNIVPSFGHACDDDMAKEYVEVEPGISREIYVKKCQICHDISYIEGHLESQKGNRHYVKHE
jgi:hypothetical protein